MKPGNSMVTRQVEFQVKKDPKSCLSTALLAVSYMQQAGILETCSLEDTRSKLAEIKSSLTHILKDSTVL